MGEALLLNYRASRAGWRVAKQGLGCLAQAGPALEAAPRMGANKAGAERQFQSSVKAEGGTRRARLLDHQALLPYVIPVPGLSVSLTPELRVSLNDNFGPAPIYTAIAFATMALITRGVIHRHWVC